MTLALFLTRLSFASEATDYLQTFQTYLSCKKRLSNRPDSSCLAYLKQATPLGARLRTHWLEHLAKHKQWATFLRYYTPTEDRTLQCHYVNALYQQGQNKEARLAFEPLWLTTQPQPANCKALFSLFLRNKQVSQALINQRIALALDKNKVNLALELLSSQRDKINKLRKIRQDPTQIRFLTPEALNNELYLYGLKQMITKKDSQAIRYWYRPQTAALLSEAQQQNFIATLALHKTMHNEPDAPRWFAQLRPKYHTPLLMEWQARFALKNKEWDRAEALIQQLPNKNEPDWQYWLARIHEARGQTQKANAIYLKLAELRDYYGFLSSAKLHQPFNFHAENEKITPDQLNPYQSILLQIKTLVFSKKQREGSLLLNDFFTGLPAKDKPAFLLWMQNELKWYDKSIVLSHTHALYNLLTVRFPLVYQQLVETHAKQHQLSDAFVYAIIRQESAFRETAVSSVGAQGLMQLMPATARQVGKSLKFHFVNRKQLFNAPENIQLGTAYLKQLGHRFNGHPALVSAAYNAGPSQVRRWLPLDEAIEADLWIETIPWHETRNYLKNIVAFQAIYQYRMGEKPDLSAFLVPIPIDHSRS